MKARINRDWEKKYSIVIDGDKLYWGRGSIGDLIFSIPALLEDYPHLENADDWREIYKNHHADSPDELDALEKGSEIDALMQD